MSITGISPKQTLTTYRTTDDVISRRVVRTSWNTSAATGTINGYGRVTTPFRAVNNLGDFLGRTNYVCGGSNQVNSGKAGVRGHIGAIMSACDNTGVPASVGNNRYVADSSDYIRYKKQRSMNQLYNDTSFGGDDSNGSYTALMRVRR